MPLLLDVIELVFHGLQLFELLRQFINLQTSTPALPHVKDQHRGQQKQLKRVRSKEISKRRLGRLTKRARAISLVFVEGSRWPKRTTSSAFRRSFCRWTDDFIPSWLVMYVELWTANLNHLLLNAKALNNIFVKSSLKNTVLTLEALSRQFLTAQSVRRT